MNFFLHQQVNIKTHNAIYMEQPKLHENNKVENSVRELNTIVR